MEMFVSVSNGSMTIYIGCGPLWVDRSLCGWVGRSGRDNYFHMMNQSRAGMVGMGFYELQIVGSTNRPLSNAQQFAIIGLNSGI